MRLKNNIMSKIVVKIQLLTMEMISDLAVFIFYASSPFVHTNALVAERLQNVIQN